VPSAQRLTSQQRLQPSEAALRVASGSIGARIVVIGKEAPKPATAPTSAHGVWAVVGAALGQGGRRRAVALLAGLRVIRVFSLIASAVGGVRSPAQLSQAAWNAFAGSVPYSGPPAPPAAPESLDAKHYIDKYGFDQPNAPNAIGAEERARLAIMLPAA